MKKFATILKISKFFLVFLVIFAWLFSGFPQIFNFPPEIEEAFAVTAVYSSTGTSTWVVPANVTRVTFKLWGAGGAGGGTSGASGVYLGGAGGGGGFIQGTATTTPGQSFRIVVGAGGTDGTNDTVPTNGGGGGGGGGYSAVLIGASATSTATTTLFMAAGGGGGGGGDDTGESAAGGAGGAGGGATGANGVTGGVGTYGSGGTQTAGGAAGTGQTPSAGTWLKGGVGGGAAAVGAGGAGGANGGGKGGSGSAAGTDTGGGGGGGSGWYGGGGGGALAGTPDGTGGGGGGSSFASSTAATAVTNTAGSGVNPGNNTDDNYAASAGVGGASTTAGNAGRVVILYSRTPSFAGGAVPTESSDPVDYGSTVTFTATAGDADNDPWYLAICDSGGAFANSAAAPTCLGTSYCASVSTAASSSPNTCNWTANTAGLIAWQGYACDATSTPYAATCSSANTTNSPLTVKGTLTLAEEGGGTPGQITDQFGADTSTTTELFGFRLTANYENASTTLTIDLSSVTGIVSGDITSGNIYVDSDTNGRITASETTTAFGCGSPSISAGSGTIACNATTTISAATDYIYKATVSNLTVNDTITFGLSNTKIIAIGATSQTYTSKLTVSGTATNVAHTADVSVSLTLSVATDDFFSLTPGTPRFATSTVSVDTNNSTGWNVTLSGDDVAAGGGACDLDTDASVNIADLTPQWIPGGGLSPATTTPGNAATIASGNDVLAFRVMTASGTPSFISTSWWGSTDGYPGTSLWAGIASSTVSRQIGKSSASCSGANCALNTVLYYLDVPATQRMGVYSCPLIFTATMN